MPVYLEKGVLPEDPFKSIDEAGVGRLITVATQAGRAVREDLKIGICGEHGGDAATNDFCYRSGLSYVSCSPYRVPIARLAGAQAVLRNGSEQPVKRGRGRPPNAAPVDKPARRGRPPLKSKNAPPTQAGDAPAGKVPAKRGRKPRK
jgi:pyruvate,orthophosphate dikinase